MMSRLATQRNNQGKPFKPKIYQEKGNIKERLITMTETGNKVDKGQVVKTDSRYHLTEIDFGMDKISEKQTSGKKILQKEVISEEETEDNSETTADLTGIEVGQVINSLQYILEKRTEVAVHQD